MNRYRLVALLRAIGEWALIFLAWLFVFSVLGVTAAVGIRECGP